MGRANAYPHARPCRDGLSASSAVRHRARWRVGVDRRDSRVVWRSARGERNGHPGRRRRLEYHRLLAFAQGGSSRRGRHADIRRTDPATVDRRDQSAERWQARGPRSSAFAEPHRAAAGTLIVRAVRYDYCLRRNRSAPESKPGNCRSSATPRRAALS